MRVMIWGADGYLGWPTAMHLARAGHDVVAVDSYLKRTLAREVDAAPLLDLPLLPERARLFADRLGVTIAVEIGDLRKPETAHELVRRYRPDAVVHYAEQPSAPYSMRGEDEARLTLENNLGVTFNLIQAVLRHAPECAIVKLGTMGEYGTPNIPIEEGWLTVTHEGRRETFLYPRQASSLYHTTKILDTDLLWFYVRSAGLRVTDLMQGPVYGLATDDVGGDERLAPAFHYDDIFGTVLNRFLVQALVGHPLTVYGRGEQRRGYLDIRDTLTCVRLALEHPPPPGEMRIYNQFTEIFSVNELAARVASAARRLGLEVSVVHEPNPRMEAEEHFYEVRHEALQRLGLVPHLLDEEALVGMLERLRPHAGRVDPGRIRPRVRWTKNR
jgi:UDP-sulfoquinovose synthase